MENTKIRFKDLSGPLMVATILAWVFGTLYILAMITIYMGPSA